MQIESLKIYCDVVRFRSFSRGAEVNDVLQSAASQTVHSLEDHLGATLIDRSCRPWKLTREGEVFYQGCRELLTRYREVEAEVRKVRASVDSVVRVAAIYSVNLRDMGRSVQRFHELRPKARVEVEYLHPDRVCERVLNDEVNLGIISFPHGRRGLSVIPWRKELMVVACPPAHRLAKRKRIGASELDGESFVGFDAELVIWRQIDRYLKRRGVDVNVVSRFDNIEAIKRAVEAGAGVAILPQPALENEVQLGTLASVPLAGEEFARPLGIVHRRGRKLYANTSAFIEVLQQNNGNHEKEGKAG
jgi:DNA-binding transcriptional LysR family regulator